MGQASQVLWLRHNAVRSSKLCFMKLAAMSLVDMNHSPYFLSTFESGVGIGLSFRISHSSVVGRNF